MAVQDRRLESSAGWPGSCNDVPGGQEHAQEEMDQQQEKGFWKEKEQE